MKFRKADLTCEGKQARCVFIASKMVFSEKIFEKFHRLFWLIHCFFYLCGMV